MNSGIRNVRLSDAFYDDLYRYLGPERGPAGEPSSLDFETYELPWILHRFAVSWESLPERYVNNPRYRVLVTTGSLVYSYAVTGELVPDGSVTLLQLRMELYPPELSEDEPDETRP